MSGLYRSEGRLSIDMCSTGLGVGRGLSLKKWRGKRKVKGHVTNEEEGDTHIY